MSFFPSHVLVRRTWLLGLVLTAASLVYGWGLVADSAGQTPVKKQPGDPPEKPKKNQEETYDTDPNKKKKTITVDDDEGPEKVPVKKIAADASDLANAARQTKHPELQKLYRELAEPHDAVSVSSRAGRVEMVQPLTTYFPAGEKPHIKGSIRVTPLDAQTWKALKPYELTDVAIEAVKPYELLAIEQVDEFLKRGFDRLADDDKRYLSLEQTLQAAETALDYVLRAHDSLRTRNVRQGEAWDAVQESLRKKQSEVHLKHLDLLAGTGDWDKTFTFACQIGKIHTGSDQHAQIARRLIQLAEKTMGSEGVSDDKYREGRRLFDLIEQNFPGTASKGSFADKLHRQAEALFARAKAMGMDGKTKEALELLNKAEDLWRNLPGLHDERLHLGNAYPLLRVAVNDLPVHFLPGLANTDAELRAGELLFESLVRPTSDPEAGQAYQLVLAERHPRLGPMARQFDLIRGAVWSRDKPVTAADVRHTVALLKNPKWPGFNPSWNEMVEGSRIGKDRYHVTLTMSRPSADPLGLMTFKILPADLTETNFAQFDKAPQGSGPFVYQKPGPDAERYKAVFLANQFYADRLQADGKARADRLPHIREIHFVKSDDPVKGLQDGVIDMLLDPPFSQISKLVKADNFEVVGPKRNRRIYFLAINHRRRLLQNSDLRRALALAINREQILKDCFRFDLGDKVHRPLNGPYPPDSWASDPNARSLDRADQATVFLNKAKEKVADLKEKETTFSLKYDKSDTQARAALLLVQEQVKSTLGINLELQPEDLHTLCEEVEKTHVYDLAYYHYDFPSESYWLWPLLDQTAVDGKVGNYLGYQDDGPFQMEELFRQVQTHRNFADVQRLTRQIHGVFATQVPFIPLWQLDSYLVHTRSLKANILDPLLVFPGVEHWVLERR